MLIGADYTLENPFLNTIYYRVLFVKNLYQSFIWNSLNKNNINLKNYTFF